MSADQAKPGKRFRLLLYERLYEMLRWPSALIAVFTFVLWWNAPEIAWLAPFDLGLLLVTVLCAAIFVWSFLAGYFCFVQCHPTHLRIQTPLYRVVVSYQRIHHVRPIIFKEMYSPSQQRWGQRHFLEPLFGLTAVGVNLKGYPLSERWLRLWLNEYMFTRDAPGFLFLVEDWMTLIRQIDVYKDQYLSSRIHAARPKMPSISPFLQEE